MSNQDKVPADVSENGFGNKIQARVYSVAGMALVSICLALVVISTWDDWTAGARVGLAMATAAGIAVLGQLLRGTRLGWLGVCLLTSGYSLGYFFAFSSHYITGLDVFADPVHAWLAMLGVAGALTLHGFWNRTLAWFGVPGTLLMGSFVIVLALLHPGRLILGPIALEMSVAGSIGGLVWSALLSRLYKRQLSYFEGAERTLEQKALWWVYRIAHELYFVAAAVSGLALPFFCKVPESMPFWWAMEGLLLLAIMWKEGSLFKVIVVGVIHGGAVGILLEMLNPANVIGVPSDLALAAVPAILLLTGLVYRLFSGSKFSAIKHDDAVWAHRVYMAAGLVLSTAMVFYRLGAWNGYPVLLAMMLGLHLLSLALKDVLVHRVLYPFTVMTLIVYGIHVMWWSPVVMGATTLVLFAMSFLYGRIALRNGWPQSDWEKALYGSWYSQTANDWVRGYPMVVEKEEAVCLECVTGFLAYVALASGLAVLLPGWEMAAAWAAAAVFATAYGLVSNKVGHLIAGGTLLVMAVVRVVALDLILKHSTLDEVKIASGAVGVCLLVCAALQALKRLKLNGGKL